jgi:hypothetical protein
MNALRRAVQKHQVPTKVERLKARLSEDREDARKLAAWSKAVRKRDEYVDRYDGKPCRQGAEPHPRRGEAHHIEPRANIHVRYDPRNGITLAYENHERLERGELRVVGSRHFTVHGKHYIDGRYARVKEQR